MLISTTRRRPARFQHVGVINQQIWSAHARRRAARGGGDMSPAGPEEHHE